VVGYIQNRPKDGATFHICDVLSVVTDVLVSIPDEHYKPQLLNGDTPLPRREYATGLIEILGYASQANLRNEQGQFDMWQVYNITTELKPLLKESFPFLADIELAEFPQDVSEEDKLAAIKSWVEEQVEKYGAWHEVFTLEQYQDASLDTGASVNDSKTSRYRDENPKRNPQEPDGTGQSK